MDVLMMAVWRRKPDGDIVVHSVQGSQNGSASVGPITRHPIWAGVANSVIMLWPNRSSVRWKKKGSENTSIKLRIRPGQISSCSKIISLASQPLTLFLYQLRFASPLSDYLPSAELNLRGWIQPRRLLLHKGIITKSSKFWCSLLINVDRNRGRSQ